MREGIQGDGYAYCVFFWTLCGPDGQQSRPDHGLVFLLLPTGVDYRMNYPNEMIAPILD